MKIWDAVVVGGGPAGASAAYDLARQGKQVVILEKKAFPRFKPCAGGLTIKALARLRFPVNQLLQGEARELRVGYKNTTRSLVAANSFCAFTVREQFDDYCLRQALDAGAKLTIIDGLKDIQTDQHQVTVITSRRETFRSRFLIGADGAHSQVRRITGLFAPARTAIAVEGLLSRSHIPSSYLEQSRHMTLDFGVQPLGYGWLFPKADHVNVGLYTYLPEKSRVSRRKLAAYAKARLGSDSFRSVCGYPIATGGESYRPHHARILLVGDAAGMAEALLGEGIHNAIATGQAAAAAVNHAATDAEVAPAFRSNLREIQQDILLSRRLAPWFYHSLPIAWEVLTRYPVAPLLMNGFAAGMTLRQCQRALMRFSTEFERPVIQGLAEGF